jgi:triosephosphate isomerase
MQKRRILIANWKTYIQSFSEIDLRIDEIKQTLNFSNIDLVVCPPSIYLQRVKNKLENQNLSIGSQNFSSSETNANTGEILATMLTDLGCEYSILGHSEIRERYAESSDTVATKAKIAFKHNITPIICVGETLETRTKSDYLKFLIDQTIESLPQLGDIEKNNIIIAYEPIWSIGTGKIPSITQIEEVLNTLKSIPGLGSAKFVYGGSVNEKNIDEICDVKSLDGVLVGGASTDVTKLNSISQALSKNSIF